MTFDRQPWFTVPAISQIHVAVGSLDGAGGSRNRRSGDVTVNGTDPSIADVRHLIEQVGREAEGEWVPVEVMDPIAGANMPRRRSGMYGPAIWSWTESEAAYNERLAAWQRSATRTYNTYVRPSDPVVNLNGQTYPQNYVARQLLQDRLDQAILGAMSPAAANAQRLLAFYSRGRRAAAPTPYDIATAFHRLAVGDYSQWDAESGLGRSLAPPPSVAADTAMMFDRFPQGHLWSAGRRFSNLAKWDHNSRFLLNYGGTSNTSHGYVPVGTHYVLSGQRMGPQPQQFPEQSHLRYMPGENPQHPDGRVPWAPGMPHEPSPSDLSTPIRRICWADFRALREGGVEARAARDWIWPVGPMSTADLPTLDRVTARHDRAAGIPAEIAEHVMAARLHRVHTPWLQPLLPVPAKAVRRALSAAVPRGYSTPTDPYYSGIPRDPAAGYPFPRTASEWKILHNMAGGRLSVSPPLGWNLMGATKS